MTNEFGIARLTPEIQARARGGVASRWRRQQFVKVPLTWVERLKHARHKATYCVALYVLHQHWRTSGKPVTVSNKSLGLPRRSKWRGIRELERLGLIRAETHLRKSPVITLHTES